MPGIVDAPTDRGVDCASVRSSEAEILLQAIVELHVDGILSGTEFEAKRAHLTSCL
ncbi:MAG: hypothetical protein AB8G26_17180 [Ilumatobacter sp.]